jgi:cytochrome P450
VVSPKPVPWVARRRSLADRGGGGSDLARQHPPLGTTAFRNEAATLFMAGHETTANLLAWAFYLLSQAPEAEARLVTEAQSVLGGRAAGWDDLPSLPYTRAVVDETLRLYPPVPLLAREAQAPATVAGHAVARDTLAMVVP